MLILNAIQDLAINREELEEPFPLIEGIYLLWTPTFIKELISEAMMSAMGGLEYVSMTNGDGLVLSSQVNDHVADEPLRVLSVWHSYIHEFLHCLWVIKDNSVNPDLGFVHSINSQDKEVASCNKRSSLYTCADGCRRTVEFSRAELIQAREMYERFQDIGKRKKYPSTLNPPSQVQPTGSIVTADAVRALSRAWYFVNSARDCSDLSVKVAHYCTSLEVLFSTDAQEISHKLSERIALFLGNTLQERKRLFSQVKRLYLVRSKVVHGDVVSGKTTESLAAPSLEADELLRGVLRHIMDSDELIALFEGSKQSREEYFVDLLLR